MNLIDWLHERADNCRKIASEKHGADRAGWIDDARYFDMAITALSKEQEIACFKCGHKYTLAYIYRCFDCDVFLCKDCMRSHFGNQHEPHPLHLPQWEAKLAAATERAEKAERELKIQDDANEILTRRLAERERDAEAYQYIKANAPEEGVILKFTSTGSEIIWGIPFTEEERENAAGYLWLRKTYLSGTPVAHYLGRTDTAEEFDAAIIAARNEDAKHGVKPCPACPDGSVWTNDGPTTCPVCNGYATVNLDGSPIADRYGRKQKAQ